MVDELLVVHDRDVVATLSRRRGGQLHLEYDAGYATRPDATPLSVCLPLSVRTDSPKGGRAARGFTHAGPIGIFTLNAHGLSLGTWRTRKFLPGLVCMLRPLFTPHRGAPMPRDTQSKR